MTRGGPLESTVRKSKNQKMLINFYSLGLYLFPWEAGRKCPKSKQSLFANLIKATDIDSKTACFLVGFCLYLIKINIKGNKYFVLVGGIFCLDLRKKTPCFGEKKLP